MVRVRARYPSLGADVMEQAVRVVEWSYHVGSVADELGAGRFDVVHDELQTLS